MEVGTDIPLAYNNLPSNSHSNLDHSHTWPLMDHMLMELDLGIYEDMKFDMGV